MKKPPSGAKTPESLGSRSPREESRRETDRKPRLLWTRRSRQPGLRRQAGRRGKRGGEVGHRALVRARPCPPGDWPGSEVGGGVRRLRPRGWALLCVLPGIYWVY